MQQTAQPKVNFNGVQPTTDEHQGLDQYQLQELYQAQADRAINQKIFMGCHLIGSTATAIAAYQFTGNEIVSAIFAGAGMVVSIINSVKSELAANKAVDLQKKVEAEKARVTAERNQPVEKAFTMNEIPGRIHGIDPMSVYIALGMPKLKQ